MNGKVCSLTVFPSKEELPADRDKMIMLEGLGIKGDRHCKAGERQISILSEEADKWKKSQEIIGFCFRKFKANIVAGGLSEHYFQPGTILVIGDAVIEITEQKTCYDDCPFAKEGGNCILRTHGAFGKVVSSGEIQISDTIKTR